jgi:hypothetical protein
MASGTFGVAASRLRQLLTALARLLEPPARAPQLLPAELVLDAEDEPAHARLQPPPIPAEARLPVAVTGRTPSAQERAWQELMNGRHPRLILRSISRGPSPVDSRPA